MEGIPQPQMNWGSTNLPDEWQKFEEHATLIFYGPLLEKREEQKVSYHLIWVESRGREVCQTWGDISAEDQKKLETYYTRFRNYVQLKLNPIFARFKFYNETQGSDNFDSFLTRLRIRVRDCQFDKSEEMIRDRIVFGINNPKAREKLIIEGDKLTLDKTIHIMQNMEYCQEQLRTIGKENVDAVKQRNIRPNHRHRYHQHHQQQQPTAQQKAAGNSKDGNCSNLWTKKTHTSSNLSSQKHDMS